MTASARHIDCVPEIRVYYDRSGLRGRNTTKRSVFLVASLCVSSGQCSRTKGIANSGG
jgi:hypothetical protein